jgi:hypothetical protein
MATPDRTRETPESTHDRPRGRMVRAMGGTRAFIRVAYRDPEHIAERLALYASDHLAEPSRDWAETTLEAHPDVPRVKLAGDLRNRTAAAARIDGASPGRHSSSRSRPATSPTSGRKVSWLCARRRSTGAIPPT